jgi:succinate-acetate transporter protein
MLQRNKRRNYFLGFAGLLIIEFLIAKYVRDDFIRPYLGDYLVVILLYCFLMFISQIAVVRGLIEVLLFSFAIEFFQMVNIVKVLQYQPPDLVMILLGSSFSTWDLLAYSLGLLTCYLIEKTRGNYSVSFTKSSR